jgi:hypothetical protein
MAKGSQPASPNAKKYVSGLKQGEKLGKGFLGTADQADKTSGLSMASSGVGHKKPKNVNNRG